MTTKTTSKSLHRTAKRRAPATNPPIPFRQFSQAPLFRLLAIAGLVAVGGLVSHLVASSDSFKLIPGRVYHSPGLAMTATYPKNWKIDDKDNTLKAINIVEVDEDSSDTSATIIIAREPVDGDLVKVSQGIFSDTHGDKVIASASRQIGGQAARSQETLSTYTHELDVVTVNDNGIGYIFTMSARPEKWVAVHALFETLLRTVQFDR